MSDTRESPPLLVIASDPGDRSRVEGLLGDGFRTVAIGPDLLADSARYLDAAAAVLMVDSDWPEEATKWLAALPAAMATVLLVRHGASDPLVDALVSRLAPKVLFEEPFSPRALRYAASRALEPARGAGARRQHRRAHNLLGVSSAIREVLDQVHRVAPTPVPVLILGETGTGKELVARAIHEEGDRAGQPFVPINCGALPESLLESELFGAERGAFTGAERAKSGVFEQAHGGTLFLDEVGEMSPALQVKLLRALESGEIRRLGATGTRRVDVRIVSATHRSLEDGIAEGIFRQDLFYRLNTVTLYVPPLRRRAVDIPFLAQHFAEEFGASNARRITLGEDFIAALSQHDFPGNVRELRNAVERAIALVGEDGNVGADQLPPSMGRSSAPLPRAGTLRERIDQLEVQAIREALQRHEGNRTHAAEALGLSRVGLRQKMRRHGLD